MICKKEVLATLDHCYAVSVIGPEKRAYFASEECAPCLSFDSRGQDCRTVWETPGGTMSMVEIPGSGGDFLAIQNFLPVFRSENAKLVWVHPQPDGSYQIRDFVSIPFVHRFDLMESGGVVYFVACTLCGGKAFTEDWSQPGKVYVGVMPARPEDGISLSVLLEGITRNHGYCGGMLNGRRTGLVTGDEGIFAICPPAAAGGEWSVRKISDRPTGDAAIVDIDGDGQDEIATIEPFHGADLAIYKLDGDGLCREMKRFPGRLTFGHAIWGGQLLGSGAVVCGYRQGDAALFCLRYRDGAFYEEPIDCGGGPSNIAVVPEDGVIYAANHHAAQAVRYTLTAE